MHAGRATTRAVAGEGVAYELWAWLERVRVTRNWSKTKLAEVTDLDRTTLNRLKDSVHPPQAKTINAIVERLGLDRERVMIAAGILQAPPFTDETVRDAIAGSKVYSASQRRVLLEIVDALDRANRAGEPPSDAGESAAANGA